MASYWKKVWYYESLWFSWCACKWYSILVKDNIDKETKMLKQEIEELKNHPEKLVL